MKRRKALKRSTGLKSRAGDRWKQAEEFRQRPNSPEQRRQNRLGKTSKGREKKLKVYRVFRRRYLAEHPQCELGSMVCTNWSTEIHHVVKTSHGGALHPGPKADRQGQVFMASCQPCNRYVEDHPLEARQRGWVKDNNLTLGRMD